MHPYSTEQIMAAHPLCGSELTFLMPISNRQPPPVLTCS